MDSIDIPESVFPKDGRTIEAEVVSELRLTGQTPVNTDSESNSDSHTSSHSGEGLAPGVVALSPRARNRLDTTQGEYLVCTVTDSDAQTDGQSQSVLLRVVSGESLSQTHDVIVDAETEGYYFPSKPGGKFTAYLSRLDPPVADQIGFKVFYDGDSDGTALHNALPEMMRGGWEFPLYEVTTIPAALWDGDAPVHVVPVSATVPSDPSPRIVKCTGETQRPVLGTVNSRAELPASHGETPLTPVTLPDSVTPTVTETAGEDPLDTTGSTEPGSGSGTVDQQSLNDVGVTFDDIAGLDDEIREIRKLIELPFEYPEAFERLEIDRPTGVLLYGPPGTGKSLLAEAISNEVNAVFTQISASEIMSKHVGESSSRLKTAFEEAASHDGPGLVFIDEIDSLAPSRSDQISGARKGVVTQLLRSMDGLAAADDVVVIAATNKPDSLDEALRRGGRFDKEIEISVPDEAGRREIIETYVDRVPTGDIDVDGLVSRTRGYVGADIDQLFRDASLQALERVVVESTATGQVLPQSKQELPPSNAVTDIVLEDPDIDAALKSTEPSGMREFAVETPSVRWDDIGGLEETKLQLKRAVQWPLNHGDVYSQLNMNRSDGVLLYGPPGTGKTMLARAVATESEANFISIRGPELVDKYVGETEAQLREVFERARTNAPSIVFFDEIDAIAGDRVQSGDSSGMTGRVVSQLLTEMDGLGTQRDDVNVIATTNRRDSIDDALLRAGRFSTHIHVPLPGRDARKEIFNVALADRPTSGAIDVDELADKTSEYSGADITFIVEEAAVNVAERVIEARKNGREDAAGQGDGPEPVLTQADLRAAIDQYDSAGGTDDRYIN